VENLNIAALRWLGLAGLVIGLDQACKAWISATMSLYESIPVLPFLNLTLLHNTGAAFSFLADAGGWQRWLFSALALVVSVLIIFWLFYIPPRHRLQAAGLALILGGALGNVWDRITLGYVVDFLDIYYQTWHWPAFNIADSAISVGAVLLIVDAILFSQKNPPQK